MKEGMKGIFALLLSLVLLTSTYDYSVYAGSSKAVKIQTEWNSLNSNPNYNQNIVKGIDKNGNTVWTYSTGYYVDYSDCYCEVHSDKVYVFDGTTLVILNLSDGKLIRKLRNIPSGVYLTEFDAKENLYAICSDKSTVYKISSKGKLEWTARCEWIDYYLPYEIEIKKNKVNIYSYWSSKGYSQDVYTSLSGKDGTNLEYGACCTYVEVGQTLYADIDNKAGNEKIYIKEMSRGDYRYDYSLYINDVKVKTIKDVQDIYCSIIDIQEKKKGKEIVLSGSNFSKHTSGTFGIYRYKNGRLKKIGGNNYGYFSLVRIPTVRTSGKGNVTLIADTVMDVGIGNYTGKIKLKLVKGKLKIVNAKKIVIESVLTMNDETLNLGKKTKVYKSASIKSAVKKTLNYGDRVKILKVKIGKFKKTGNKYQPYKASNVYVYIKDSKGDKGWIKIGTKSFQEVYYAG